MVLTGDLIAESLRVGSEFETRLARVAVASAN